MDIEAYTNIDNAKIDSKENIESFVQLCDDYISNNNNHDDLCIGAILNKFFKIVENLAQQIESLNKDFITKGFEDEVESLRSKADNINETAMKVLHIIDIIPKKFTLNDENLQHIQNASSVWARYAVLAEKLVSEDISSSGILNMDKFINLVNSQNSLKIKNEFKQQIDLFDYSSKATLESLTAYGRSEQVKLVNDVYNHKQISISKSKKDDAKASTSNGKKTKVNVLDRSKLWIFIIALAAPFIGFFSYDSMWMIICVLLVAAIQFLPWLFLINPATVSKVINVEDIDKLARSEEKLELLMRFCFVILAVLNIFPFLASSESFMLATRGYDVVPYEGGLLVTLTTIILIGAWLVAAFAMVRPGIHKNKALYDSSGKTIEEEQEEKRQESLRKVEERIQKNIQKYGAEAISLGCNVFVNEKTKKLFVQSKEFDFKDILDFTVTDNAVTIHSASTSTAKTNTGSMIGRAVVGGAIMGSTGAIIGGATAKQDIVHSASESKIKHDYSIIVTVNSISSPNVTIKVGKDEATLNKIVSTLTVILHQK
jgi:hypothetical protein